ncbi:MAG: histidine kinase [Bacteroidia bacterium]|nr:histidine kinase [Bacteroidia bacterium]
MIRTFLFLLSLPLVSLYAQPDSLVAALRTAKDDTSRLRLLGDITWSFYGSDREQALKYADEAVSVAQRVADPRWLAQAYSDRGAMYMVFGDNQQALTEYEQALAIRDRMGLADKAAATRTNIAAIRFRRGEIQEAIDLQLQAIRVFETANMAIPLCQSYGNLANYYSEILDWKTSRLYAEKAYKLADSLGIAQMKAATLFSIAKSYEPEKRYRDMIRLLLKCLEVYEAEGIKTEAASLYGSLGNCYANEGITDSAILYIRQAVEISTATQDTGRMAYSYVLLGHLLADEGKTSEAKTALERGFSFAKISRRRKEMADASRWLGEAYQQEGTYDKAYQALNTYVQLQDSILTLAHQEEIARLQITFETERKEQQIALLSAENRNQMQLALIGGLLLLTISAAGWILLRIRHRHRLNAAKLETQQRGIEALIEGTESERRRLAAELHDGLAQQLGALRLAVQKLQKDLEQAPEPLATRVRRISDSLQDAGAEVRSISHQLLPRALAEVGLAPALEDMLSAMLQPAGIPLAWEIQPPELAGRRFSEKTELTFFRIAQETVNNTLKHAGATAFSARLRLEGDELQMTLDDNGRGFDKQSDTRTSLGLVNMHTRAEHIGAILQIESQEGTGTQTRLRVKI